MNVDEEINFFFLVFAFTEGKRKNLNFISRKDSELVSSLNVVSNN